jgi:rhodanese-related sulfurtransferase
MFATLKKIFAVGPKVDLATLITDGALIIDVRTPAEFSSGHLKKAINIPLGNLQGRLAKLKKDRPIITCCASGMRSRSARSILRSNGFGEVYNGGSWQNLRKFEQ